MSRVVFVSGGTGGLGQSLVKAFYQAGCRVAFGYHKSSDAAKSLVESLPDRTIAFQADVSDEDEMNALADRVITLWQTVHVVVVNAGVTRDDLIIRQRETDWDMIMSVNLKGAFHTIKAFCRVMPPGGHIILISSYAGLKGKTGQAAYSASKAALTGMAKSAARELASDGIQVNIVIPGFLDAGMGADAGLQAREVARREGLFGRLSDADEAARFIVFLSGMHYATGQVFSIEQRII
jgi:3-oxoacyl-[acyl-carrier protein] reductase